ncbi:MAG: hypothetical protein D6711_02630 [Chloroflexi bacterium]|nr:MAG: hypothetical protein D6711_02630 [Chloroflexota bacterium]
MPNANEVKEQLRQLLESTYAALNDRKSNNYNEILLKRDILLYSYILQQNGQVQLKEIKILIAGFKPNPLDEAIKFVTSDVQFYPNFFESVNETSVNLSKVALKAIPEVFDKFHQTNQTSSTLGMNGFEFVRSINLIGEDRSTFVQRVRGAFEQLLSEVTVTLLGEDNGQINDSEYIGEVFKIAHNDWSCLVAVVANVGAFDRQMMQYWVGGASYYRENEGQPILLIASDSSDSSVTNFAVKYPYFYHSWPLDTFQFLYGLEQLVKTHGSQAVLEKFPSIFPPNKADYFKAKEALARLEGKS